MEATRCLPIGGAHQDKYEVIAKSRCEEPRSFDGASSAYGLVKANPLSGRNDAEGTRFLENTITLRGPAGQLQRKGLAGL